MRGQAPTKNQGPEVVSNMRSGIALQDAGISHPLRQKNRNQSVPFQGTEARKKGFKTYQKPLMSTTF